MINREKDIRQKISETLNKQSFGMQDVQTLALCWGALQVFKNEVAPETNQEKELTDVFPALSLYQLEHTEVNLHKLCVEIEEFCRSVYASTRSENERTIFFGMLDKLRKM